MISNKERTVILPKILPRYVALHFIRHSCKLIPVLNWRKSCNLFEYIPKRFRVCITYIKHDFTYIPPRCFTEFFGSLDSYPLYVVYRGIIGCLLKPSFKRSASGVNQLSQRFYRQL